MRNTGVFVTTAELDELDMLSDEAAKTPVIFPAECTKLWKRVTNRRNELAVGHGLPTLSDNGNYGITFEGEFLGPESVDPNTGGVLP